MEIKVQIRLFLINLIFISSSFCKNVETKKPFTTTTIRSITSSPSSLFSTAEISSQISKWSKLVDQLKVKKEEGEEIVRLYPLLLLAYKIYKFEQENKQTLDTDKQLTEKFFTLKNDIPERIRSFIWGSKCAIRNAENTDLYLNIVQTSETSEAVKLELGNGTKSYWKFLPYLEKLNSTEDKLAFIIQNFDNSDNWLGIKYVEQSLAGGLAHEGGILEIIPAGQNGPGKMIKWTIEPFISAGGPSKDEVVNWMSTEHRHPVNSSTLYLHSSLEAAAVYRIMDGYAWAFDCDA